jgi:uncharacterized protein YigE (DUF2233 family)
MYHPDNSPVGRYVEEGWEIVRANTNAGPGNFHMRPDGVFYRRGKAKTKRKPNMRMMLKILIPTETGNHAIKDGSLHKIFETTMGKIKPEAAYFVAEHGQRCAMMFFNMNDASDIPSIVEPLMAGLNARVQLLPVMNAEDLQKGLNTARQAM